MGMTATRRFRFSYAHELPGYDGKCVALHGHNAVLEVTVKGTPPHMPKQYESMVMDFSYLKKMVNRIVIQHLDHRYLNDIFKVPTAEKIIEWIWTELRGPLGVCLTKLRLYETEDCWIEKEAGG